MNKLTLFLSKCFQIKKTSLVSLSLWTSLILTLTFAGGPATAAIPSQSKSLSNMIWAEGSLRGGKAGPIYTLVDLRRSGSAKSKMERLVLDFGDGQFNPHLGQVGYYQIELKKNPNRLVVHLNRALSSKLETKDLLARMQGSSVIKDVRVDFDRMGQALYLTFDLKKTVALKATPVQGGQRSAKLVIDLMDRQTSKSKVK